MKQELPSPCCNQCTSYRKCKKEKKACTFAEENGRCVQPDDGCGEPCDKFVLLADIRKLFEGEV